MPIMRNPDETPGSYASRSMKKIIANLFSIVLLPVILLGFLWEAGRQGWELGTEFANTAAEWLNS